MATYLDNNCSLGLRYDFLVYLTVNLVFSHLGFWSENFFLIASFPYRSLPLPLYMIILSFSTTAQLTTLMLYSSRQLKKISSSLTT